MDSRWFVVKKLQATAIRKTIGRPPGIDGHQKLGTVVITDLTPFSNKGKMLKIFQTIPLPIFVIYIRFIDATNLENLKSPFFVSGFVALMVIISFFYKKIVFDRILLGINLYLISGGLAFITHQWWLIRIYNQLQGSGMILWIIATGIVTIFISPKGFIGVDSSDKNFIKKYSNYLLLFSVITFTVSFRLRGNILLSELIPFTCLFLLQRLFKNKFSK